MELFFYRFIFCVTLATMGVLDLLSSNPTETFRFSGTPSESPIVLGIFFWGKKEPRKFPFLFIRSRAMSPTRPKTDC